MIDFDAVMIVEGVEEASEEETLEAWQHLIDTGLCWTLQGWIAQNAKSLIDEGICHEATRQIKNGFCFKEDKTATVFHTKNTGQVQCQGCSSYEASYGAPLHQADRLGQS